MGANTEATTALERARRALERWLPDIVFGRELVTEPCGEAYGARLFHNQGARFSTNLDRDELTRRLKALERQAGRTPADKAAGIVRLDIDLVWFDGERLKPNDWERPYFAGVMREVMPDALFEDGI